MLAQHTGELFSAYAEVFPTMLKVVSEEQPFLCLRRGVSQCRGLQYLVVRLFSAYAEVFPNEAAQGS